MPEIALDDLRALIREEIRAPRKPPSRKRRFITCDVTPDEYDAIRAAAVARDLCLADLIRLGLEPLVQRALPRNRTIPINLAIGHRARDEKALKEKARQGVIASRLLARDTGAAVGQTASVPVPKLRGPQRPE